MPPIDILHLLSSEEINALAKDKFVIGSVFKLHCYIANKEKLMIIAGFKYDKSEVAFVHINTEINPNIFRTTKIKDEHLVFDKTEERDFLSHNSFIDCTSLVIRKSEDIYNSIVADLKVHLGNLTEDDLKIVRAKISNSPVIRRDYKKHFGVSLAA